VRHYWRVPARGSETFENFCAKALYFCDHGANTSIKVGANERDVVSVIRSAII